MALKGYLGRIYVGKGNLALWGRESGALATLDRPQLKRRYYEIASETTKKPQGAKSFSSECSLSRELPRENYAHFTPFNFLGG